MNKILFLGLLITFGSCTNATIPKTIIPNRPDPHSFSQPEIAKTTHLELDVICDFEKKQIIGTATYTIERTTGEEIILDLNGPVIESISLDSESGKKENAEFSIGPLDSILGYPLIIKLKQDTRKIIINYHTTDAAKALQWMTPSMTFSKKFPFLFTQSQSIFARTWLPCQDSPGIRFTYNAKVKVPEGMMAAMSATNPQALNPQGQYTFDMDQHIPAYLMALAVGDFSFRAIGPRTGVYAESNLLEKAVWEFEDLEKMVNAAEQLYGTYPWGRYDVIVLPSSFPFGGMENPKLTFLTPSVIAGDRSLTSLLAHELAHSWSGNLVTNATWEDFWLNEGFTTYFESRIMESLYGKEYADMLSLLGSNDLKVSMTEFGENNPLTQLKLDLKNQDPEDALSDIAYEKGKRLLRYLEERVGRDQWDLFLRSYFKEFAFKSNTTERFQKYLLEYFKELNPGIQDTINIWLYKPGLIDFIPSYTSKKFDAVDQQLSDYLKHKTLQSLHTKDWSTHEWIHFIHSLPIQAPLAEPLEQAFQLSKSENAEIASIWLIYLIKNNYGKQYLAAIDGFLTGVGRRKFVLPIFEQLIDSGLKEEAKQLFNQVKDGYHPITYNSVNELLSVKN
ncbi:MAG: M1 family metallopeptidase [Saprospiraceae bacterium]|nr:M1 family metallopeptidase [Saprospiraceae bacterium]